MTNTSTTAAAPYPIVTAAEAKAQGLSPWALISVARQNMKNGADTPTSQRIRQVAAELARMTGVSLKLARGANDNAPPRKARPQGKRRAA
jgi:hypothetical protein